MLGGGGGGGGGGNGGPNTTMGGCISESIYLQRCSPNTYTRFTISLSILKQKFKYWAWKYYDQQAFRTFTIFVPPFLLFIFIFSIFNHACVWSRHWPQFPSKNLSIDPCVFELYKFYFLNFMIMSKPSFNLSLILFYFNF